MAVDNVTRQLVEIQNEQRAQKTAHRLNYGALERPSENPTASLDTTINTDDLDPSVGINARFIATFTRTDGVEEPPMVDFAYDYLLGLGYYEDLIASGVFSSATGRDTHATDEAGFVDGIHEVGNNFVSWKVEITSQWEFMSSNNIPVTITIEAISPVEGVLALERAV